MSGSGTGDQGQARPAVLGWRTLLAAGTLFGLALGLAAALLWEDPASLGLWAVLLLGLGWAGWDVRPRQIGGPAVGAVPTLQHGRRVRDGPFIMVELAGGAFFMGSPDTDAPAGPDERPRHAVRVNGFRMGRTPVTRAQWRAVMGDERGPGGDEHPVTQVTWEDAVRFCNALSRKQGYRACYRRLGVWPLRRWVCDWRADGYRLPTEAEWEYACRAGGETAWSCGDDPAALADYAWFTENADGTSHPVASLRPNDWGLYDLHGNVWEWCWDRYGPYPASPATDPRGPWRGRRRVLRGGSFVNQPVRLRSAFRVRGWAGDRGQLSGFRCVRLPARPH